MSANLPDRRRLRAHSVPRLTATVRAVRAGLAASAALLALSGSGFAAAADFAPVPDLTRVSGDSTPAAVIAGNAVAIAPTLAASFYLYNDEPIEIESEYGPAFGVEAHVDDSAVLVNVASIDAISSLGDATGAHMIATGADGLVEVDNTGSIGAEAYHGRATGVYAGAYGLYADATVHNDGGTISASSGYFAQGVVVSSGKYAGLVNSGDIHAVASNEADGYAFASGVGVSSFYGAAHLENTGTIEALADGYAANATGAWASIYGGNAAVYNDGDILATAHGDIAGRATGVNVSSSLLSALVYNTGSVQAEASGDYADAIGAYVSSGEFGAINTTAGSSIHASASGDTDADATGAKVTGLFANLYGEGAVSAEASADAVDGDARAYGADVYGSFTGIYVLGDGEISASAEGAYALAVGALQDGYFTAFRNEGSIEASASGDTGFAIGAMTLGYYTATMHNAGDISADASGDEVQAVGLFAGSLYGDAVLYNDGDISASSDHLAVAVQLQSSYYTMVVNNGSIEASGDGTNIAIYASGASADYIYNYGTITGGIRTGAGDDLIVNDGTINLDGALIDLGYHAAEGNAFENHGTINVDGESEIDMGSGIALVPSLNPNALYNGGAIDFQDGDSDDLLTITGDFAGDGDINVDVSGLEEASDALFVDGSVVAGTTGTINVDLLDLPEAIETLVPIVSVSGDSVSGNFVLGDVDWDEDDSFVTLDFGLVADIDASNATPDVFALGIEVTGLSDPGTLAAAIGPSVQGLMNAQVGTWRQRMGVIDNFNKGAVALWARVFQDEGSFSPEHVAGNFGNGGNFDWDQKNSGVEAGIDFSVTEEFAIGLLVAKSQADTDLDGPGAGGSEVDADTWGVYGTWISPNGFYLDASYRWMNFDVDLHSIAGAMDVEGDAEAFNVELGYAWTLSGGLKIEPQLQYTKTSINNIDTLVTGSGMVFDNDGGDSSRGRLGVAIRKSFGEADTGWLWTPYATLSAVREFDGEAQYEINDSFVGVSSLEGTSTLVELGFTARHQNWSVFGGLNRQAGGAVESIFGGQLGVRYSFGGGVAPAPAPAPPPAKACADLDDDGDRINNCDDKCIGSPAGQAVGQDGCPVPAPEPEPVTEPKPFRG